MALLEASARSQRSGFSSQGATLSPSTTTAEGGSLLEVTALPSGIADTDPEWVGAAKKQGTWVLNLESVVDQWVCHRMRTGGLAQWRGLISWGMLRVRRRVESVWPNIYGLSGNREREGERNCCNLEVIGLQAGREGFNGKVAGAPCWCPW